MGAKRHQLTVLTEPPLKPPLATVNSGAAWAVSHRSSNLHKEWTGVQATRQIGSVDKRKQAFGASDVTDVTLAERAAEHFLLNRDSLHKS